MIFFIERNSMLLKYIHSQVAHLEESFASCKYLYMFDLKMSALKCDEGSNLLHFSHFVSTVWNLKREKRKRAP